MTPPCGEAAIREYRNTGSAIAAMIDLVEEAGMAYQIAVAGNAAPSGPVQTEAYEWMVSRICTTVEAGCDAILLDLHGAMVTERHDDGEAELLRRLRQIAPGVPIAVALDMHCNLSNTMVQAADVLAGYQTYPHVDVYETGVRAAKPIVDWLKAKRHVDASYQTSGNRLALFDHILNSLVRGVAPGEHPAVEQKRLTRFPCGNLLGIELIEVNP
ncbi:MAG: hypothetical protein EBW05_06720 [Betaproteobacteria bacterium]|nr:hypothetical protein [Betaproteobacteria bacterium]